ncbi:MAG: tRNA lysidine(34) synthetase TilS [Lawsonibacter sp.]
MIRAGPWTVEVSAPYQGEAQQPFDLWLAQDETLPPHPPPPQTGDRLRLPGRPEKTVKKWLIDEKIPRLPPGPAARAGRPLRHRRRGGPGACGRHIQQPWHSDCPPAVIPWGDDPLDKGA